MKRAIFKLKWGAWLNNMQKLVVLLLVMLAFELGTTANVEAQRRGGHGHVSIGHFRYAGRGFGESRLHFYHSAFYPRYGAFYWFLPFASINFLYDGLDFYFHNGIYYQYYNGRYEEVPAPIGYRMKALPKGYEQFYMDSIPYFYYYGSFYVFKDKKYEVVPAPVGAMVERIPAGYEKEVIKGETYYIGNGVQYKVILSNNEIWYQVIKSRGYAPASSLPPQKELNAQPESNEHS